VCDLMCAPLGVLSICLYMSYMLFYVCLCVGVGLDVGSLRRMDGLQKLYGSF
jgi:hypothetical protein